MIAWFARNSVAANLLMVFIVVSGLIGLFNVRGETFPEFTLDMVSIEVPYLGAAPEEVEQAVCIRIEEAIQGIDGIKQITSTASEGMGSRSRSSLAPTHGRSSTTSRTASTRSIHSPRKPRNRSSASFCRGARSSTSRFPDKPTNLP